MSAVLTFSFALFLALVHLTQSTPSPVQGKQKTKKHFPLRIIHNSQTKTVTSTCATSPASPEDRRTDKTKLRIATYNVEFLFSSTYSCSAHALDCPGDDCDWKNESMVYSHMAQISTVLQDIDADIVVMPEVTYTIPPPFFQPSPSNKTD